MNLKLGEKLQTLRKGLDYTQKEFAEYLGIPQPSLSAYENDKNSPTVEVLINIATKCNISLDWLCGLNNNSSKEFEISELKDLANVIYKLMEINEIGIDIKVNDKLTNDIETETDRWYTQLTVYGNDKKYKYNADLCQIIASIKDNLHDLETYAISKEIYDMQKEKSFESFEELPLTQKNFPELSREERQKKYMDHLNTIAKGGYSFEEM